jgi:hypothetical protein
MKFVKSFVLASLLVFTVSLNTFAGEQEIPANPAPPPRLVTTTTDEGTNPISDPIIDPYTGEITIETTDYLFFEALAALLSVY